ncbi:MAG: hypothetical protein EF806_06090 [Candidatus Methanoliparum thermophilum]|uniref:Ribonuclease P protein component 3 n=1 Tax=Methanoliparum thermophilum TaxID=2491083 RepID=A0A520KQF7_METT2|nr:RNase P subunit p30 family protein [Candidatus Methanoliparum sp. LAM-1]RZN63805.1 MAG: hypothetical protein EF806_06090 [Candidatus Methanoliparum thermophilum]BDC36472.1 hypothetical protein MTLP_11540 [Candidatus Methanoliparum sp. LAM-1]
MIEKESKHKIRIYDCIFYNSISSTYEMLRLLKRYGFSGAVVFFDEENFDKDIIRELTFITPKNFDVFHGLEIRVESLSNLKRKISDYRDKIDIIAVNGGDDKINRMASKERYIDIIRNTDQGKGIDHITARFAAENDVMIDFCIGNLIYNKRSLPAMLGKMRKNLMLVKKYGGMTILSSGGRDKFGVRPYRQILALSRFFGMERDDGLRSLRAICNIIKKNKKYRDGRLVSEGIEIIS